MDKQKRVLPLSPATSRFVRVAWKAQTNIPWDFLHSFVYARWPYLYIGIGSGRHPITRMLTSISKAWNKLFPEVEPKGSRRHSTTQASGTSADIYHGKVLPLHSAQELVMVNEPIDLPDLEQVIPYVRARAIIQQNPDHILLMQCPCRLSQSDPCLPLDVCMVIGEPFVEFLHQHYPARGRRITQQEAVDILESEDARGRVHHAFFSEMMLGRFFAICNCCSCCCVAMKNQRQGTPMLASSGFVAQVDRTSCASCGTCEDFCNFGALGMINNATAVDERLCMGCGVCVSKCPQGAISLCLDATKGIPLEISSLIESLPEVPV
jgi:Pyruvate/2-oxoacid:ferredoxin oxidoreductase delta subunit